MIPIVVIDFRVYAWDICHKIKPLLQAELLTKKELEKFIKALWAYKINRGPLFMDLFPHKIVVVTDLKDKDGDYWRNKRMQDDERIMNAWEKWLKGHKKRKAPSSYDYKGTRTGRDDISQIINIGEQYVSLFIGQVYQEPGFEADDWAHIVYKLKKECQYGPLRDRTVYLSTVDRDWSQLVDSDLNIYLANFRKPGPRERFQNRLVDNKGVIEHTEHYSKHKIEHPCGLPYVKHLVGDFGDNLPPGAPQEYFDLINPPLTIKGRKVEQLLNDLNSTESNQQLKHMETSAQYLKLMGYPHFLQ